MLASADCLACHPLSYGQRRQSLGQLMLAFPYACNLCALTNAVASSIAASQAAQSLSCAGTATQAGDWRIFESYIHYFILAGSHQLVPAYLQDSLEVDTIGPPHYLRLNSCLRRGSWTEITDCFELFRYELEISHFFTVARLCVGPSSHVLLILSRASIQTMQAASAPFATGERYPHAKTYFISRGVFVEMNITTNNTEMTRNIRLWSQCLIHP